ncbi:MAG: electron transport complex, RnfABCDGE type, subunit [Polaromonas sp.]|nr:electron transport complex, RnfABCDGE type, subunit [Polaromonas sp.]
MTLAAHSPLFERINAALPQTQCTRCGYPDCAAYAQAIASGDAAINQCPPGGWAGVQRLALITGLPPLPLNPVHGSEGPRAVAVIDEAWCIGCTLCIKACPTDAIFGSNKMMHTVMEAYCTGCELCVPTCPVDCISLENVSGARTGWRAWSQQDADTARKRYKLHSIQRMHNKDEEPKTLQKEAAGAQQSPQEPPVQSAPAKDEEAQRKRAVIQAALASARARRDNG